MHIWLIRNLKLDLKSGNERNIIPFEHYINFIIQLNNKFHEREKSKRTAFIKYLESLRVKEGKKISLEKDFPTDYDHKMVTKAEGEKILEEGMNNLAIMQDKLYAHDQYSVLIVLQAMDAAGKDGIIKHVISGLNPNRGKSEQFQNTYERRT